MKMKRPASLGALVIALAALAFTPANASEKSHSHDHKHEKNDVHSGYFEDDQIKPRTLADWEGDWQSVYPYLMDGTLQPVMEHKAEHGSKSAEEYRAYYEIGYKTDVQRIVIDGDRFTFHKGDTQTSGVYENDGLEILNYKKGNRGVRYIFKKASGDADAPAYVQFSDHQIAPTKADHYHLYWGNDRAIVLKELTNWPTYYPSEMTGQEVLDAMLAH
ncbi:MAG: metal-binding protein ZinT [Rhodobacteraceae bacterium]|nr:metal-binding protein ZinT [Paracoccaceae bacterium]